MSRVGFGGLKFYDPNPTQPAIKKKKIYNPTRQVRLGWLDFGGLVAHP